MQQKALFGSIDYLLIEFRTGRREFDHVLAGSIADLARNGVIRVLDLLVITKAPTGEIDVTEFEDLRQPEFDFLTGTLAEILAYADVANLAMAIAPGTSAGVIIWEHAELAPLAAAAQQSGEQIIAQGRIPSQSIIATLAADPPLEDE